MIEVKSISKSFGKIEAVKDLSFEIKRGEIFGFLGPNGAGKTTTIKILLGILRPDKGEILFEGENILKNIEEYRKRIGYVSQEVSLYKDLNIFENAEFRAGIYGVKKEKFLENYKILLEKFGLKLWEKEIIKNLPTGIERKASLLCALIHNPEILFLDEPTSGMDPLSRFKFFNELIKELKEKGKTILITTHYMEEAEYFERILLIHNGEKKALDTPENLKEVVKREKKLEKLPDMEEVFMEMIK
ncbi:MAG: ABC transporter ATP-binding protein [candidate division WOR-3 bacterium]